MRRIAVIEARMKEMVVADEERKLPTPRTNHDSKGLVKELVEVIVLLERRLMKKQVLVAQAKKTKIHLQ